MQANQVCDACTHQALKFLVLVQPSLKLFYKSDRAPFNFVFCVEVFIAEVRDELVTFFDCLLLDTSGIELIRIEIT